jgi:ubiquinone/menaquinone biosynthesis C-methylase UbiE
MSTNDQYIPALRYAWLTRWYDFLIRWGLREDTFKQRLIQQARLEHARRVLDLGCGTGTLTLQIKSLYPYTDVVGIDGDATILAIAKAKAARARLRIQLDYGLAQQLPYPDQSFDRVLSSLVLHHLTHDQRQQALAEVFRVLKPGGELHVVDWSQPRTWGMKGAFFLVRLLDGFAPTADHAAGLLPQRIAEAGFEGVAETRSWTTFLGRLGLVAAYKSINPSSR